MQKRGSTYVLIILLLVVLAYLIPFTLLSGVDAWYGSFLFWGLFAIASIVVNFMITLRWRD